MIIADNQNMLKTFFQYSIPCIAGMFLTSFITVIDGMFIAWGLGEQGLAAVNLTLPVLYILLALTIMSGVGGVTLGGQSLGNGNKRQANHYFNYSLVVNVLINLAIILFLALFQEKVVQLLNAKGALRGLVRDYLGIMKFFYLFMMLNLTFSMFIRGEGKPHFSLMFGVVANLLNIILDYLFICKFNLGMKGAALATGLSVMLACGLGLAYFLSKRSVYKFTTIIMGLADLKKIVFLGSAEFVAQISVSIIIYIFNLVLLKRIGIQGIAAMTIVGYVSFVQNMVLTGIAVGIHPVLSYFFGAGNNRAILELTKIALAGVSGVGIVTFIIGFFGGDVIVGIFAKGEGTLNRMAAFGLQLYSLSFIFNGYNIITAAYFTSLGEAGKAAVVSMLRSLFLVIPMVLILPRLMGNAGIWLTPSLTEFMVFILSCCWMIKSRNGLRQGVGYHIL
jgi:putative MATE family efflux protein